LPFLITRLLRLVLRLAFWLLAAVGLMSLLALSLGLLMLALLRGLLTGKRPAAGMAFSRFRQFAGTSRAGAWPGHADNRPPAASPLAGSAGAVERVRHAAGEVVDVEAREIPSERPRA
jgi:hypothetical protein